MHPHLRGPLFAAAFGAVALFAVACHRHDEGPVPYPIFTPQPGPVLLTSSSLSFTTVGAGAAQTVTASQSNYLGMFSATTAASGQPGSCAGIATISPAAGSMFTITPTAAGTCSFDIAGGVGRDATLAVTVTTTTVGGS